MPLTTDQKLVVFNAIQNEGMSHTKAAKLVGVHKGAVSSYISKERKRQGLSSVSPRIQANHVFTDEERRKSGESRRRACEAAHPMPNRNLWIIGYLKAGKDMAWTARRLGLTRDIVRGVRQRARERGELA